MNDRDAKWHGLYRVDLASGTLVEKNDNDIAGYVADPDFKVRYAQRSRDDGGTHFLQPDGKGGWTMVEEVPFEDGKTLYLYESRGRDHALYAIDTARRRRWYSRTRVPTSATASPNRKPARSRRWRPITCARNGSRSRSCGIG